MLTEIESLLFRQRNETHAVVKIGQSEKRLVMSVAPWEQLGSAVTARFLDARITSVDVYADDPEDLNLPWDIIGFDCHRLTDKRWRFVLHGGGIEYCWESQWPELVP